MPNCARIRLHSPIYGTSLCSPQDVGALLSKGVSEVVRDAARLHEQLMQMRLERGKLSREEVCATRFTAQACDMLHSALHHTHQR